MTSRRDALVRAIVGRPDDLPDPASTDLERFWDRFDAAAPLHVRLGFDVACVVVGEVLPRLHGHRAGLAGLDAASAEAVLARAASSSLTSPLCEAAKVVACFAYLSDEQVDEAVRRHR